MKSSNSMMIEFRSINDIIRIRKKYGCLCFVFASSFTFVFFNVSTPIEFINSLRKISRNFCAHTINEIILSNNENKKHRGVIRKDNSVSESDKWEK